jgi:hypothetical protein
MDGHPAKGQASQTMAAESSTATVFTVGSTLRCQCASTDSPQTCASRRSWITERAQKLPSNRTPVPRTAYLGEEGAALAADGMKDGEDAFHHREAGAGHEDAHRGQQRVEEPFLAIAERKVVVSRPVAALEIAVNSMTSSNESATE